MAGDRRRLKKDGLAEVVCELRFESSEATQLPELVVGTLVGRPEWRSYEKIRLPISDVPAPIRLADPSLRYQPILELRGPQRLVKIGTNVISLHALAPYPGWNIFEPELTSSLEFAFGHMGDFRATRIGFRFINTLSTEQIISDIRELSFSISVRNEELSCPFVLIFLRKHGEHHLAQIRISSPEFVSGNLPENFIGLVDIDIYTPENFAASSSENIKQWLTTGHDIAKDEFFGLLSESMRDQVLEEEI